MNGRIQELALKCSQQLDWDPPADPKEYLFSDRGLNEFTELIVEECCSKLVEMGESWEEFSRNPPRDQLHNAAGALFAAYRLKEDAVWELKEHFGVEQ